MSSLAFAAWKLDTLGEEALAIVEQIKPLLAGKRPVLQSVVLAECLALLLAGHWIPGEPDETTTMRAVFLEAHVTLVLELTKVNANMMGTDK